MPWLIIAAGILLRIIVLLQNRNLIIDEANLVRNLHERNFTQLFTPLDYEQYAPPFFLGLSKISMLFLGAYESSFRIFPLLCGIANLFLFFSLLQHFNVKRAIFYPLFLFATGFIYVRYTTEFKQYSSDITVSLSLLLLALKYDIENKGRISFFCVWLFAGSFSIWLSMPSVFILGGIGIFYFYTFYQTRDKILLFPFVAAAALWIAQFVLYYFMILKPSVESDYLQNFHRQNELILMPGSVPEWQHNIDALSTFFAMIGGHWALSFGFNLLLVFLGMFRLFKEKRASFLLIVSPILLLFFASGLHQFSLLPRVCLFIYPAVLLLMGLGLGYLFSFTYRKFTIIPALLICAITMVNFNELEWFAKAPEFDQTKQGFSWIKSHAGNNETVYIHSLLYPQKEYLTKIHPDSSNWILVKNTGVFNYQTNMDSLCKLTQGNVFFMLFLPEGDERKYDQQILQQYFNVKAGLEQKDLVVYSLQKK